MAHTNHVSVKIRLHTQTKVQWHLIPRSRGYTALDLKKEVGRGAEEVVYDGAVVPDGMKLEYLVKDGDIIDVGAATAISTASETTESPPPTKSQGNARTKERNARKKKARQAKMRTKEPGELEVSMIEESVPPEIPLATQTTPTSLWLPRNLIISHIDVDFKDYPHNRFTLSKDQVIEYRRVIRQEGISNAFKWLGSLAVMTSESHETQVSEMQDEYDRAHSNDARHQKILEDSIKYGRARRADGYELEWLANVVEPRVIYKYLDLLPTPQGSFYPSIRWTEAMVTKVENETDPPVVYLKRWAGGVRIEETYKGDLDDLYWLDIPAYE